MGLIWGSLKRFWRVFHWGFGSLAHRWWRWPRANCRVAVSANTSIAMLCTMRASVIVWFSQNKHFSKHAPNRHPANRRYPIRVFFSRREPPFGQCPLGQCDTFRKSFEESTQSPVRREPSYISFRDPHRLLFAHKITNRNRFRSMATYSIRSFSLIPIDEIQLTRQFKCAFRALVSTQLSDTRSNVTIINRNWNNFPAVSKNIIFIIDRMFSEMLLFRWHNDVSSDKR